MPTVETVRGPVETGDLGPTLMHEHVFVLTPNTCSNYGDEYWDEEARVADAVAKLTALRDLGVNTIVDPTVVGLGRYIPRVERINAEVDLNIVVATGLYMYDEIPHFLHYRGPDTLLGGPSRWSRCSRDIREGIAGTGVKAAFLKCVVEERGPHPGPDAGAARHRGHPRRDRRADHRAHQRAHQTGRLALDLYARRASTSRRSSSGTPATPTTSTTCREIMDQRRDDRLRPVRARPVQPDRSSGSRRSPRSARGLRRPDRALPRRLLLHRLLLRRGRPGRAGRGRAELALRAHQRRRAARAARAGRHRRAAHDDAGRQPAPVLL